VSLPDERVEIASSHELRSWLLANHETSAGAWVVTWKKGRGPYVAWADVVRELLCFGWIDSQGRKVDEDRRALLVVPRRRGSGWSRINKEHLESLESAGLMHPAGTAAVERAKADGSWTSLDEVETLREPADLTAALDACPAARREWDAFPPSARRVILGWIGSAKTAPTRERRISTTVSEAAAGRRANQWRPTST
jgi:uncharacterized protein YdeI (YjbR/CyaY-like superfamily)